MCAQFDGTNVLIALIIFYHTYTIFLIHDSNCKTLQLTTDNFYPYSSKIKIKQTSKHEQNIIITYSYSVLISVKLPQITVKLL